jgi:beta-lactamase class A
MSAFHPIRLLMAVAMLLLPTTIAAAPAPSHQDIVARRAHEALGVLQGRRTAAGTFDETFLANVPAAELTALARRLQAENGKLLAVEDIRPTGPNTASFRLRFERATARGTIALQKQAPFRISGYWIAPAVPLGDSPERLRVDFTALPGRSGFAVIRLGGAGPVPLAESHADEQFAIGSAFKLWVLDALAEEIAAGRHRWDEVVRLGPRSLPSGQTQDWPPDAPVTVETLATLMNSISDNTATDTLIRLIGRERVAESVRATGHSDPARMLPFLTTAEAFALKLSPPALRDAYARADEAGQARILDTLDAPKILAGFDPAAAGDDTPASIDSIEWFASPDDVARVLDSLRRRQDPRVLQILAVAPGMTKEWREGFAYFGYKGGSELGVANLTWLLRRPSGDWFVATQSWNDAKAPVDNDRFKRLGLRLLALVRQAP